jgi:hypothetical protein
MTWLTLTAMLEAGGSTIAMVLVLVLVSEPIMDVVDPPKLLEDSTCPFFLLNEAL